jgi:V-type H+-transporting ATPase subunit B
LRFTERFERKFLSQGANQSFSIYDSLDMAWELLRYFPKEQLKKIDVGIRDEFWPRKGTELPAGGAEDKVEA